MFSEDEPVKKVEGKSDKSEKKKKKKKENNNHNNQVRDLQSQLTRYLKEAFKLSIKIHILFSCLCVFLEAVVGRSC